MNCPCCQGNMGAFPSAPKTRIIAKPDLDYTDGSGIPSLPCKFSFDQYDEAYEDFKYAGLLLFYSYRDNAKKYMMYELEGQPIECVRQKKLAAFKEANNDNLNLYQRLFSREAAIKSEQETYEDLLNKSTRHLRQLLLNLGDDAGLRLHIRMLLWDRKVNWIYVRFTQLCIDYLEGMTVLEDCGRIVKKMGEDMPKMQENNGI